MNISLVSLATMPTFFFFLSLLFKCTARKANFVTQKNKKHILQKKISNSSYKTFHFLIPTRKAQRKKRNKYKVLSFIPKEILVMAFCFLFGFVLWLANQVKWFK